VATFVEQINKSFTLPEKVRGHANGKLPDTVLVDVFDSQGRTVGRLCERAADAFRAMVAKAAAEGVVLQPNRSFDTYRPFEEQERIFRNRYEVNGPGGDCKNCPGLSGRLCKKSSDLDTAACPGTSHHGLGIAIDVDAVDTGGRLEWLERNAAGFGFAWELSSEPWHIHYIPGDQVPAPVLAHVEDDLPPAAEIADAIVRRLNDQGTVIGVLGFGATVQLTAQLGRDCSVKVDQLLARPTTIDVDSLAASLAGELGADLARALGETLVRNAGPR
jgi:LAS superfamily LD-carboxypeptidase LdcB